MKLVPAYRVYNIMREELFKYVVNLFNDQYYTEEQAIRTCEIINSII